MRTQRDQIKKQLYDVADQMEGTDTLSLKDAVMRCGFSFPRCLTTNDVP